MADLLGYAFVSIPLIGAFAMFAIGITAIFRASRVLNLAHGAMAMVPAYVNYGLVVGLGVPLAIALPISVAAAAALGVIVERLFVRRLRPQGPTAQTVGTVAVTGLLVAVTAKVAGTASVIPPKIFPEGDLIIAGVAVSYGSLGLLVVGLTASAAMYAFFQYTEYGMAMRGAAQNRSAAALMGINPDRAAAVAWAIGGGLAGLAGILLAAVTSLDPYTLSLQVLPAFVATLIGGLESLIGAIVGSIIVGLTFGLVPALGQLPIVGGLFRNAGAPQLVLTAAALVVMVTRGQRLAKGDDSGAGLSSEKTFGRLSTRGFDRRLLLVAVVLVAVPFLAPYSVQGTLLTALQYTLIAVSLVLLIGWVGQISLAHATFVGLGALTTGIVARDLGVGFPFDMIAGAAAGTAAALALGSVALRVRGLYLAVATLIFAWMGDAFLFRSDWLGVSGGSSSIPNQQIGVPGSLTSFDLTSRVVLFIVFTAIVATVMLAVANLRDTRTGRAFFAVRGSEMAAASLGINVVRTKLTAFGLSGMLAGLAGVLVMTEGRTVVPEQFFFTVSLQYLAIAVVGGLTRLGGAVAAALVFAGLNELFFQVAALAGWLEIVSAALLAIVLLAYPGGLAAVPDLVRRLLPFLPDPGAPRKVKPKRAPLGQRLRAYLPESKPKAPAAGTTGAAAKAGKKSPGPSDWLADLQATEQPVATPAVASEATVEIPVATNGHGLATVRAAGRKTLEQDRAAGRVRIDVSGITVRFGGLTAVKDASLTVRDGEIVGLIGPNGAGKTTLFNAILGLNEPAAGTVHLYGTDATTMPPYQRARLGVARTFQVLQLFNELTVFDNLLVATYLHDRSSVLSNLAAGSVTIEAERNNRKRVERVLDLLQLSELADEHVSGLSFGTLRMVELGRALVTGAKVLMLDEPASGLNDAETARLVQVIRKVRDLGVSVLLIEHDVPMVCGVSDYVYVLDQGVMIAADTPAVVQRDPGVIAAYIGGSADDAEAIAPAHDDEVRV